MNYPNTIIGSVVRLKARFRDRETNTLVIMSAAAVRVVGPDGIVVSDEACTVSGTLVYYDWDTSAETEGVYQIQFEGTPVSGTLQIEPFVPLTIALKRRIGE